MAELPNGWRWATPDELAAGVANALTIGPFGSDLKVPDYRESGVPLVFVREIRAERFGDERTKFVTETKAAQLARHLVRPGDLLITKMGDPPGDTAVYPEDRPPAIITADCIKLTPNTDVTFARFLRDCFRAEPVRSQVLEQTAGVAQQKLSLERFRTVRLPLPPLNEQRRIVAKLEALQTRSRRAREALDAVPPLLEKLRQSILAAAFRGDLTKDWRAKHKDVEPASELLKRIRAERRKKWEEAELAKMKAKGKAPTDDRWREKYNEPEPVDATELPDLPRGWCWASADEVLASLRNGISTKPDEASGLRILRISSVRPLRVDVGDVRFLRSEDEYLPYLLANGDLLLTRYNGNPELVGVAGVVRGLTEATVYPDKLIRATPVTSVVSAEFLELAFATGKTRRHVAARGKSAAGQVGVSGTDIKSAPVPIPSFGEQVALVNAVHGRFERLRGLADCLSASSLRLPELEKTILARAFRGELVMQDPNDAPGEARPRARVDSTPARRRSQILEET